MVEFYLVLSLIYLVNLQIMILVVKFVLLIIQLSLNQQFVVINVYRPPNRDLEYQQELIM